MQNDYKILAVDDEPFNLDLIEAAFIEYDNVEIVNARDGFEALDIIAKDEFDVVLLDISMPDMDGMEVLQKIRADERLSELPILMVTANSEIENEALELGATDFLAKPYNIEVLCRRTLNYAKMNNCCKKNQNV
jgi:putative two-component system response regulator